MASFKTVLKERQFYMYTLSGSIAAAGLFAYLAGSPYVLLKLYNVTEQEYGIIFAIIASGLITSSQVNNLLLKKYTSVQIVKFTLILQTIIGLVLFIATALEFMNLYVMVVLIFLFLSCQGFNFPNSAALSMEPFEKEAGSASALMGAIQMGFGALASALVGLLNAKSAMPMTGVMAICSLWALVILIMAGNKNARIKKSLTVA